MFRLFGVNRPRRLNNTRLRPRVEGLEWRDVPATLDINVTTHLDVVDPTDDVLNVISLREAIDKANDAVPAAGERHTIRFEGVAGETITLDPALGQLPAFTKNIFLDGAQYGVTIRRDPGAAVKHRLIQIGLASDSVLSGLTFRNGDVAGAAGAGRGGAVESTGVLTVENCFFAQNQGRDVGGAISATGGSLNLVNSTVTGNSAELGGGVYIGSSVTATITNTSITLNTASGGGGGI